MPSEDADAVDELDDDGDGELDADGDAAEVGVLGWSKSSPGEVEVGEEGLVLCRAS